MITMQDIVRKVGVSRSAVSCVLNNASGRSTIRVSEETRQKILKAAKELGYRPNELARAVVMGKSRVVALITNQIQYDYTIRMTEGLMSQANEMGYAIKVFQNLNPKKIDYIADQCISHRVCSVIISHFTGCGTLMDNLQKADIPIALFGSNPTSKNILEARTDNQQGFNEAITYLHDLGHRQIGMISGDTRSFEATDRVDAFKQAMTKYHLTVPPANIQYAYDWQVDQAHQCANKILCQSADVCPTAICCASDVLAMGVLRAARRLHLDVPGDLSVVGLGNMYVSELSDPPLTTIAQDEVTAGKTLFARLVEPASDSKEDWTIWESMHIIPRESTGPPPKSIKTIQENTCDLSKPSKTPKELSHV